MARYCIIEKHDGTYTLVKDAEEFVVVCVAYKELAERLDGIVQQEDWITHIPAGDLAWQQEGDQYMNMRKRNDS